MAEPLAEVGDLEKAWRALTAQERPRAEHYLGVASRRILRRWSTVPARILAGELDEDSVKDVVVEMVLGIIDGAPIRNARSWTESAGSMSRAVTLQSGLADRLTIEDWMVEVFEGYRSAGLPRGSFPPSEGYEGIVRRRAAQR